jgi:hypothetical protein
MDWILALALVTFAIVAAFLFWTLRSTQRYRATGGHTSGVGGPNDPLSGAGADVRPPDQMRASLDDAAARESM